MSKRTLEGKIVSTKNSKTLVVNVERKFRHPVLSKVIHSGNDSPVLLCCTPVKLNVTPSVVVVFGDGYSYFS